MVIRNRTGKRIFFLKIKFFLELCGYVVLEEQENALQPVKECNFRTIGLYLRELCEKTEEDFIINADKVEDSLILLCEKLAIDTQDYEVLISLLAQYTETVFMNLYTTCYLYAKRDTDYRDNNEMLISSIEGLIEVCEKIESDFLQKKVTYWREVYFYLYLVNRVNEGTFKMRGYAYRKYDELKDWFEQLKMAVPNREEVLLLEAETIRNTQGNYLDHLAIYSKLEDSISYCVRFWAQYAIGELYIEQADNKYKNVYGDRNLIIKEKLYKKAMTYFEQVLELKADEVRAVFKLGLQSERSSVIDWKSLRKTKERFLAIERILEQIPFDQSTTLEFEYLYKTYLRLCSTCQREEDFSNAEKYLDKAVKIWEEFNKYSLFEEIYGSVGKEKVVEVLKKKYSGRDKTFETNRVANREKRNLLYFY